MNRLATAFVTVLLLAAACVPPALAANPKPGDILPDPEAKVELQAADAAALGLPTGAKSLRLSQIKARALLVEVYSLYCPRCQATAPKVNRLYERLAASPQAKGLVFVAVAAGDTPYEVEFFRKKFQAPMPMVPDSDYVLHKALQAVGTPSYFVLKALPKGKGLKVLFFQEGAFEDENAFFDQVLRAMAQD